MSVVPQNPIHSQDNDLEYGTSSYYQQDISIKKFGSISSRHRFVQKVFCNLTVMLTITGLSCYAFMTNSKLKSFSESRQGDNILYLCIAIMFGTIFAVICCERVAKTFPTDYGILTIFTLIFIFN